MTTASPTPEQAAEFEALVQLAQLEHRAGRLAEAAAVYEKILALRPDLAEIWNNLGVALSGQGKLDEAVAQFERATTLNPQLFQAHQQLGDIFHAQGKLEPAAERYRQVIALRPDLAEPHNNLGNILLKQGQLDLAATQFERALALRPDSAEPHNNLGGVLREQGRLEEAAARFQQALTLRPDYAEAHSNLGGVRWEQGQFAEAANSFKRALDIQPDLGEAHFHLADLKTFRAGDADLDALEAMAADTGCSAANNMLYVHFALGKALEDVGDYPRAFQHMLQGNALKRRSVDYDGAAWERTFGLVAETFDGALFDRIGAVGDPSPAPIFVLGMPRSGSTLVEQILASHPQVHAAGELKNLDRVVRAVADSAGRPASFPAWVGSLDADGLRRLGQAYLAGLPPLPEGKLRVTDKMPGNFLYVGLIRLILPNARIIHTVRNPIDTCVSCFSKLFSDLPFSYDLAELGRYYRGYQALMEHWRSVLPAGAMLDVAYEDVVENIEEQARRLIDYCGLPWDDRCLAFHETDRAIATPSTMQVRRPLYRSSLARWRRYEAYLQPLLSELGACR